MSSIPGLEDRVDLLRKLGLCPQDAPPPQQPLIIESPSGVVLIGDHNTVHVVERPARTRAGPRGRS